jgi:hypothetical protein
VNLGVRDEFNRNQEGVEVMQHRIKESDHVFPELCSSITVTNNKTQFVSVLGGDIYCKPVGGTWSKVVEGLPYQTIVNRLKCDGDEVIACTNKGLFKLYHNEWKATDVLVPCYNYLSTYGCGFAATEYGIWCGVAGSWAKTEISDVTIYDFLYLSQFLVYAHASGITMYDRYTDEWAEFPVHHPVTSLAVYGGNLFGTTSEGDLVQSDGHGGFIAVRLKDCKLFSLIQKGSSVFACSDCGLFQLKKLGDQIILVSITLGTTVVDIDICDNELYMATLMEGIRVKTYWDVFDYQEEQRRDVSK